MKYLVFYLITFAAFNIHAQTNSLSSFNVIMQKPNKIAFEKKTLQNIRTGMSIHNKYLDLHDEKLSKLENLIQSKILKSNIEKLSSIARKFQWKKTEAKLSNIQVICRTELQKPDECLDSLDELRQFVESQDLIPEKLEYFFNQLDLTEESAFEYSVFFKDFKTYFDEEVNLINSEFYKHSINKRNTSTPVVENNFKFAIFIFFIISLIWFLSKRHSRIIFIYKSKKWLKKLKKENVLDLSLISKNIDAIYPLILVIENEFKNAKINILSNDFSTTLKIQIPTKDSFYYDLDCKKYINLRKCILDLQNKMNPKDRIHLSDVYDPKGNINNQFIKINLAKT